MTTIARTAFHWAISFVLTVVLSGCAAAPRQIALAPLMIELPQAIIDACKVAEGVAQDKRIIHFWATFDDVLWLNAGPEVRPVVFGPAYTELGPLWPAFATGKAGAERAWLDSAHKATTRTNLTAVSNYQLALMRCYFPGAAAHRLNVARITSAFEELALSVHSKGQDYVDGVRRMLVLQAWMQWAAFSEACVETGLILPKADLEAWRLVRRLVLRAVLLDAHHDPELSERRADLMPPGLTGTSVKAIRDFTDEVAADKVVREALFAVQGIMTRNPQAYPANVPPPTK
jgi:hypothetical protein